MGSCNPSALLGLKHQAFLSHPTMKSAAAESHDRHFTVLSHTLNPGHCLCQDKHPRVVSPVSEQWV